MTLAAKAELYEREIEHHIKRTPYGYVAEAPLRVPGDRASAGRHDSDNDGLWTAMYGAGECFGDQLTAGASVSDIDIVAIEDLKIMVFEDDVIGDLLNQSPVLADEIGDAIELRRQAVQSARKVRGEGI